MGTLSRRLFNSSLVSIFTSLGRCDLSSSAAKQKSQEQTRRRGNQNRMAGVLARVVFGFVGNLANVLALQILDLVTDGVDFVADVIAGSGRGLAELASALSCCI